MMLKTTIDLLKQMDAPTEPFIKILEMPPEERGMSYVYEFRRFLDTAAIREHNRNICFVPSEQAILICASQKASILDKIKAELDKEGDTVPSPC